MSDTCDIRINMNTLEEAIKEYTNCKNTLENLLTDLESGVKDVESTSWKGEAKDAFVNIQFPDFKEGMQKHCDMIAELIKELKETAVEFNTLDTELKTQMSK
jgi:WXG100 family type VII secretion target